MFILLLSYQSCFSVSHIFNYKEPEKREEKKKFQHEINLL